MFTKSAKTPDQIVEQFKRSPEGKGVIGRSKVDNLAVHDAGLALSIARGIEHPWYRCQALASVVEFNSLHPQAKEILLESLSAAYIQSEPNRVASVSWWPLRLLIDIDSDLAALHTSKLLEIISTEPHGLRRLDGLAAILRAVLSTSGLRDQVLVPFCTTLKACVGWRTERIVDVIATVLAPYDSEAARSILASRPVTRYTSQSRGLLGV